MLTSLAAHNEWANRLIFAACADIAPAALREASDGYDSVIGILNHLVQVEYAFLELAHGRVPGRTEADDLAALQMECAELDRRYTEYARGLDESGDTARRFLVPWFGFEITLAEGVIQPLTHSHKHRADVSMLLPKLGGVGVEMDFIQWLDEVRGARDRA